ncbi:hypothetical protein [Paenibacillus pseudetheri]|uniref:Uncharacterized protein n=1 Tax=Paenibacillus pseudetheri TaxID=2897682 RepID=A0ABM9BKN9_9BACL|nr:hypothetical protein [Paenibacillus pseudetheri]CAH1059491.1 hypothetical protein PAECIP111894_05700 [Paenibacillus pseudetheri]
MKLRRKLLLLMLGFAIVLCSNQMLVFASDNSNYVSLEKRDSSTEDNRDWLTIKQSEAGLRIISNDEKKEIALIDNFGGIYLNGDLYLNNKKINDVLNENASLSYVNTAVISIISLLAISLLIFLFVLLKLKKEINVMKYKFMKESIKGEE